MTRGHYALLRYRPDIARGEFRNIGVVFVDAESGAGEFKTLSPGSLGRAVEEHGLLANAIASIRDRVAAGPSDIDELAEIAFEYGHSLVLSGPQPAIGEDGARSLVGSLYQALVAPKISSSAGYTKGHVLDRLARWFTSQGSSLDIAAYVDEFLFDGVLNRRGRTVCAMHVSSFAARTLDLRSVERDVGHFLFAAPRVAAKCVAVIQPPPDGSGADNRRMHERVTEWLEDASVEVLSPQSFKASFAEKVGKSHSTQLALPVGT